MLLSYRARRHSEGAWRPSCPATLWHRLHHRPKTARFHRTDTECTASGYTIVRMRSSFRPSFRRLFSLCAVLLICFSAAPQLWAVSNTVVISQIYTAGGNSGASYNSDYVELFNLSSAPVSLNGWALQYFSATGTGSGQVILLPNGVTLSGGQRYLVSATPGTTGAPLPSTAV